MERITHDLVQGTPEWILYRATHDNASDAAAMLGISPHKTRNQLLHERWLGMQPEFSQYVQQRVLDPGHEYEALARKLAEELMEAALYPVVMSWGNYSASMDGLTFDGAKHWEHKRLNAELLACMPEEFNPGAGLPKYHRVQLEQQFRVADTSEAVFTASKWNGDQLLDARHAFCYPDAELWAEIEAGWALFHQDLAVYVPPKTQAPAPVGKKMSALPSLVVSVEGRVLDTNMEAWKAGALSAIRSVNRELSSDEDFATAANMVTWCSGVEAKCEEARAYTLSQTASIAGVLAALDEVQKDARECRLDLDKLVERRKKERKEELVSEAVAAFHKHVADLAAPLAPYRLPTVAVDFPKQIKGKSNFQNMKDALDAELARGKLEANRVAGLLKANIDAIAAQVEFGFLFADAATLVTLTADHLALTIKTRISEHKAEAARKAEEAAEAAREKIRAEEAAKLKAEQEAQAKAEREAQEARDREAQAEADRQAAEDRRRKDEEALRERQQADADLAKLGQPGAPEPSPAERRAETVYSSGLTAMESPAPTAARPRAFDEDATLKLGDLTDRWGAPLGAKFIAELGVEPRKIERGASLYSEGDWLRILRAIEARANRLAVPF